MRCSFFGIDLRFPVMIAPSAMHGQVGRNCPTNPSIARLAIASRSDRTLRTGLLALLLGPMFATRNKGHRYERSKDAARLEAITSRFRRDPRHAASPAASVHQAHEDGEKATARAAVRAGSAFTLSSLGSMSMEVRPWELRKEGKNCLKGTSRKHIKNSCFSNSLLFS